LIQKLPNGLTVENTELKAKECALQQSRGNDDENHQRRSAFWKSA